MAKKDPDFLKHNDDGSVDITLVRPLEVSGAKVSVVRMREPTVADQEASSEAKGSAAAVEIAMFANLCELAPDDIRKMPLRNYRRLQTAFMGFID